MAQWWHFRIYSNSEGNCPLQLVDYIAGKYWCIICLFSVLQKEQDAHCWNHFEIWQLMKRKAMRCIWHHYIKVYLKEKGLIETKLEQSTSRRCSKKERQPSTVSRTKSIKINNLSNLFYHFLFLPLFSFLHYKFLLHNKQWDLKIALILLSMVVYQNQTHMNEKRIIVSKTNWVSYLFPIIHSGC